MGYLLIKENTKQNKKPNLYIPSYFQIQKHQMPHSLYLQK